MQDLYPAAGIFMTHWDGFHNWMVLTDVDLFQNISKIFIEEYEKEFGKQTHYLVDSFNEMEVPFPPIGDPTRPEVAASYGEGSYRAIS